MLRDSLNEEKFQNAVLYLLKRAPVRPGVTVLLKMLYFSDYQHYRTHLSPITGAQYVVLPNGPVINDYKQLFSDLIENGLVEENRVPVLGGGNPKTEYVPLYEPNMGIFTAAEIQTMDAVLLKYGTSTGAALSELTLREGPWAFAWSPGSPGRAIPYILFRWLDNMPDEEDVALAQVQLARQDVAAQLEALRSA